MKRWVGGCYSHMKRMIELWTMYMLIMIYYEQCEAKWEWNISLTLHPKEQNLNGSSKLLPQISQMWETPFPDFGCGLSFRNNTLALFITYVCTPLISNTFWISATLTTSWYEDLLIYFQSSIKHINTINKMAIWIKFLIKSTSLMKMQH